MALAYLLDTNVISELVRRPKSVVADRVMAVGTASVCTSIIVAAELRFGIEKSGSDRLRQRVEDILLAMPVLPFVPPSDRHYGELRWHLARQGELVGPNDLLIAAHTLAQDLTLVTANTREFQRVPGLKVEDWSHLAGSS